MFIDITDLGGSDEDLAVLAVVDGDCVGVVEEVDAAVFAIPHDHLLSCKKNDESIFRVCPGSSPAKKELLQTCTGFVIARFSFVIIVIIIIIIMMIIATTISIITGITMMVIKVKTSKTDPLPIFDRVRDFWI